MAEVWYYQRGDQRVGPVSSQKLKRLASVGDLQPTDLLWKEGMPQPLAASHAKGLFSSTVHWETTIPPTDSHGYDLPPPPPDATPINAAVISTFGLSTKSIQPGNALRQPWLLYGGLLWGIGFTVCGIGLMVGWAGVQTSPLADTIGGLFFFVALVLTCIGLVDKFFIHRGQAAMLRPGLRLFACIFGVTGLLGIVLPVLIPAIYAGRHAAEAYKNQGDWDKAIADYTEAIRLDPKYAMAYSERGVPTRTRATTTRPSQTTPRPSGSTRSDAIAYWNRGGATSEKGDYDKAIADYTEAIRLDPNYALAYFNRGVAYEKRATTTRPSRTSPRPSGSTRITPWRTTTGALLTTVRATWTRQSQISARPSGSIQTKQRHVALGASYTPQSINMNRPSRT